MEELANNIDFCFKILQKYYEDDKVINVVDTLKDDLNAIKYSVEYLLSELEEREEN